VIHVRRALAGPTLVVGGRQFPNVLVQATIHGAIGLSRELGLEELARDVRMLSIPDGTNGILTLIQGREITKLDTFRN
jgi:alkylation response protein AidB-like acyl-CoA dehydrogenase